LQGAEAQETDRLVLGMPRLSRTVVCAVAVLGLAIPSTLSASAESQVVAPKIQTTTLAKAAQQAAAVVRHDKVRAARKARVQAKRIAQQKKITRPTSGNLSAGFGDRSGHWAVRHTGLDFDAKYGERIGAVMAGKVIFRGYVRGYGNLVVIRNKKGVDFWYAHMSKIKAKWHQPLRSGQTVGYVGATGNATGPHLHLEIRKGDYPINPALFLWGPNKGKIQKMKIKNWVHDPDVVHLSDLYN